VTRRACCRSSRTARRLPQRCCACVTVAQRSVWRLHAQIQTDRTHAARLLHTQHAWQRAARERTHARHDGGHGQLHRARARRRHDVRRRHARQCQAEAHRLRARPRVNISNSVLIMPKREQWAGKGPGQWGDRTDIPAALHQHRRGHALHKKQLALKLQGLSCNALDRGARASPGRVTHDSPVSGARLPSPGRRGMARAWGRALGAGAAASMSVGTPLMVVMRAESRSRPAGAAGGAGAGVKGGFRVMGGSASSSTATCGRCPVVRSDATEQGNCFMPSMAASGQARTGLAQAVEQLGVARRRQRCHRRQHDRALRARRDA